MNIVIEIDRLNDLIKLLEANEPDKDPYSERGRQARIIAAREDKDLMLQMWGYMRRRNQEKDDQDQIFGLG